MKYLLILILAITLHAQMLFDAKKYNDLANNDEIKVIPRYGDYLNDEILIEIKNVSNNPRTVWGGSWGCANLYFVWYPIYEKSAMIMKIDTIRKVGNYCEYYEPNDLNPVVDTIGIEYSKSISAELATESFDQMWSVGTLFNDKSYKVVAVKAVYQNGPKNNNVSIDYYTYFRQRLPNRYQTNSSDPLVWVDNWKKYANKQMWRGTVESGWAYLNIKSDENLIDICEGKRTTSLECVELYPIGDVPYFHNEMKKELLEKEKIENANKIAKRKYEIEEIIKNLTMPNKR